jgi:hypothetical protein
MLWIWNSDETRRQKSDESWNQRCHKLTHVLNASPLIFFFYFSPNLRVDNQGRRKTSTKDSFLFLGWGGWACDSSVLFKEIQVLATSSTCSSCLVWWFQYYWHWPSLHVMIQAHGGGFCPSKKHASCIMHRYRNV